MIKNKIKGFTLVELLAVIVILAIILVIAVPKVMSVIEDAKKATLESTAKMIASQAEKQKVQNTVLGNDEVITCKDITNINDVDYASCEISFEDNTAKVTITGAGKFAGLYVCGGTKTGAEASKESCAAVINAVNFKDDDWSTIVAAVQSGNYPYEVGNTKLIDLADDLGEHTIRIANTTPCSEVSVESKTACGFVLEFADIIIKREMNSGVSNLGGWPGSEMRKYLNDVDTNDNGDGIIYNAIPEELRNAIIETTVVSGHGSHDTGEREDDNFESTDKIYLLSVMEVFGSNPNEYDASSIGTITRQLDYYEDNNVSDGVYSAAEKYYHNGEFSSDWWFRSALAHNYGSFCVMRPGYSGVGDAFTESDGVGVSPAFRLSD